MNSRVEMVKIFFDLITFNLAAYKRTDTNLSCAHVRFKKLSMEQYRDFQTFLWLLREDTIDDMYHHAILLDGYWEEDDALFHCPPPFVNAKKVKAMLHKFNILNLLYHMLIVLKIYTHYVIKKELKWLSRHMAHIWLYDFERDFTLEEDVNHYITKRIIYLRKIYIVDVD
ncbi:MAG TPA: hypothetical protein VJM74_05695 [Nitrososphaeraceae archaeon]|nr:hypothetical protein [Nitrososphaeraceae archaeon]